MVKISSSGTTLIKIAKLYVISKLIWDSISIGNPPIVCLILLVLNNFYKEGERIELRSLTAMF